MGTSREATSYKKKPTSAGEKADIPPRQAPIVAPFQAALGPCIRHGRICLQMEVSISCLLFRRRSPGLDLQSYGRRIRDLTFAISNQHPSSEARRHILRASLP